MNDLHNGNMLNVHELKAKDLQRLSPDAQTQVVEQLLQHIAQQSKLITSQAQAIKFRDVKIERITFELARLKSWRFAPRHGASYL